MAHAAGAGARCRLAVLLGAGLVLAALASGCVPRDRRSTVSSPVASVLSTGGAAGGAIAAGIAGIATLVEESAASSASTPSGSPRWPTPTSTVAALPRPLEPGPARDGIDGYPCRTESGEMDVVVAESPERAERTCEYLGGEPCVCTVEELEAAAALAARTEAPTDAVADEADPLDASR